VVLTLGTLNVPSAAAPPDTGKLFALLRELGAPDVSGGTLVHLQDHASGYISPLQYMDAKRTGIRIWPDAWLMGKPDGAGRQLLVDARGRRYRIGKTPDSVRSEEGGDPCEILSVGSWKPVDCRAFATAFTNAIASEKINSSEILMCGPSILLMAVTMDQNGFGDEATVIARTLIEKHSEPQRLIVDAINELADLARETALTELVVRGGWEAYAEKLEKLRRLYGERWRGYPNVAAVAETAKARAAGFSLPDLSPWPEAARHASTLTSDKEVEAGALLDLGDYPWLIAPPAEAPGAGGRSVESDPVARLLDGGMASVPALLKLADNPTLIRLHAMVVGESRGTPFIQSSHMLYARGKSSFGPGGGDDGEDAGALIRPATLGEVSMRLLRNLIPGGGEHGRRGDGEAHTPAEIAAWHEGHRTMSRVDLAFEYLQLGSMGQQLISLDIILSEGGDGAQKRVADTLLRIAKETNPEDSGFYSITSLASTFVARLEPTEATAFLERFSAALKAAFGGPADGQSSSLFVKRGPETDYRRQMLNETLKSLRQAAKLKSASKSISAVMDEALADEAGWKKDLEWSLQISSALERADPAERMSALTNAITRAKTAPLRCELLAMLPGVTDPAAVDWRVSPTTAPPWRKMPRADAERKGTPFDASSMSDFWRAMLADARRSGDRSVASVAATTMEGLNGTADAIWREGARFLGQRWNDLLVARAKARLDGHQPVEMPTEQTADGVDRAAVENRLANASVEALPGLVAQLDVREFLALALRPCSNATLRANLGAAASRIVEAPPAAGITIGSQITSNVFQTLIAILTATPEGGYLSIAREDALRGVRIATNAEDNAVMEMMRPIACQARVMNISTNAAMLMAFAAVPRGMDANDWDYESSIPMSFWSLGSEASAPKESPDAELEADRAGHSFGSKTEHQDRFWRHVANFCAATNGPLEKAEIRIQVMPAKELQRLAAEGESGDL